MSGRTQGIRADSGIRSTALRGTFWTTFGFGATYAIRLLSTLVMTRLLAPDIFGLMSLSTVLLTGLAMISDLGTTPSIIRSKRGDELLFLDTAWSIQAVRGIGIGLVVTLLAWPISRLYDEPRLFPILCALAMVPALQGAISISTAVCARHMDLFRLTTQDLIVQAVSTALTIFYAWWMQSVWALVIGHICGMVIRVAMSYLWLPPYRPQFYFERAAVREIVHFGAWILLGTLFTYAGGQGTQAVMGGVVSIETLGLITIATTIAWAFGDLVSKVLGQVAFPAMSRIYHERPHDLPQILGKVKAAILLAILPGFLLIAVFSQQIIDLLYDPRYALAGAYMGFFAMNGAVSTLAMPYQNLLLVTGNSRAHSVVMGCNAVLRILFLLIGAHLYGVYGMVAGLGIATFAAYLMALYCARRNGTAYLLYDAVALLLIFTCSVYLWDSVVQI